MQSEIPFEISYLINHYRKVSGSLFRREILALERQACHIRRIALHGWDSETTNPQDRDEQPHTRNVLKGGLLHLITSCLCVFVTTPLRVCSAVVLATRVAWHASSFFFAASSMWHPNKQVRITGWVSSERTREEILEACGLVLPNFAEGLPAVTTEALALCQPISETYVDGIPDLMHTGATGCLFPADNIKAPTIAIDQCLSSATSDLKSMGDAAYERVISRHSTMDIESVKFASLFAEKQ